jgi:hypothetical protein
MRFLAIDPGNTESAYVVIDIATRRPLAFGKVPNKDLLQLLSRGDLKADQAVIEMVASYGMPVGAEVFETCVWIGRFYELLHDLRGDHTRLIKRGPVKLHHCHSSKAKDSNITHALVDRFAPGATNRGKGTKADPGWFYGFHSDIWQAYALAVYAADQWSLDHPQTAVPAEQGEGDAGTAHHPSTVQGALI